MSEATDNVEAPAEAPEAVTTEVAESRPEWLPEKFNTPEDLVNSYSSLESKLGKGQEELRESIMNEIESEAFANRPEKSGDYTLPEGMDELATDPNVEWWSNFAWENGFSQDEFNEGLNRMLPPQPDLDSEIEKLGDNANARIEAVALWSQKNLPAEFEQEVMRMGETAEGVQLLEHFMSALSSGSVSGDATTPTVLGKQELESMMKDPRYWDNTRRDPAYVKQVDEGFAKLYK
jgi:hypothetical protein